MKQQYQVPKEQQQQQRTTSTITTKNSIAYELLVNPFSDT